MHRVTRDTVAVIGVIGRDDVALREHVREAWSSASHLPHSLALRFAVSTHDSDGAATAVGSAASEEADLHRLECLGQSSGLAVVVFSLADAWFRFAASHPAFAKVPFIGRADTDAVISPVWLDRMLLRLARRQPFYLGRVQWFSWHRSLHKPVGFGFRCSRG